MPQRVQSLRSSTKKQRPAGGSREAGELYVNFPDLQLGVINASKNPLDLIAVRFFSATTDYSIGDFVLNSGTLYRAKVAITAAAFSAAQWDAIPIVGGFEPPIATGTTAQYWRGDKSWQALDKTAVGLANVDNTSDANKPVSSATQTALNLKAPLASPALTGTPSAPTPATADSSTTIATTAHVQANMALKANASHTHAQADVTNLVTDLGLKAPLAGPVFTGDARAVTPATSDNDTSIATTAYVKANIAAIGGATAQARNRVVNGAMQVSQENGDTSSTLGAYFPADQWYFSWTANAGTRTVQRIQAATPNGSVNRLRMTITAADASLAAGEYLMLYTAIEGNRVADFRYGSASAKQSILRFGFKGPAGTYAIRVGNNADDRSYVAVFTVSAGQANTDTERTFIIPGDTTGTWLTNTGVGMYLYVSVAWGSTGNGVAGWQSGTKYNTSACTNGMATAGAVFELFDVGLYLDPSNTGVAPAWQMPDEAEELRTCQRYLQYIRGIFSGYVASGALYFLQVPYTVAPRTTPILSADYSSGVMFPVAAGVLSSQGSSAQENRTANGTGDGAYFTTVFKVDANM